jgi:glycosyltransferase involved in cell wall biosynthesis
VRHQVRPDDEIIVVIDHNDELFAQSRRDLSGVLVVPNDGPPGLSAARNTGIDTSSREIVVFLDDDAKAEDGWLDRLLAPYRDPAVMGVGGMVRAAWPTARPTWFPPEFDWVVGCSYAGLPADRASIRNPIGAAMSFRRTAFEAVGQFTLGLGRIGKKPLGCEETEFGIRLRQHNPHADIVYEPSAIVRHRVTLDRTRFAYFRRRCYSEGFSKAQIAALVGTQPALDSERSYLINTLPNAVLRYACRNRQPRRAGAIVAGVTFAACGYALGKASLHRAKKSRKQPPEAPTESCATATTFSPAHLPDARVQP